ncbi:MAG: hypothetical protein OEY00_09925 [Gammaproteobacteria bacterium]|nr:hypothetical protein [Gammaproteobacteria bacterium]
MSYETVLIVFLVFSIPAFILVMARLVMLKRQERAEQADLDIVFSMHKDDSRGMSL